MRFADVEIAGCDLVAGARDVLLRRFPDRLDEIALAGESHVRAHAEQGRDRNALEQRPGVEIHFIRETRIAGRVGGRHIVEPDRAAVGHDDALPHD